MQMQLIRSGIIDSRKYFAQLALWQSSANCVMFLVLMSAFFCVPIRNASAQIDAAQVQRSIDRGVAYLRKSQNDRGGWDEFNGQSCGLSALCTLTLLNCGLDRDDPDIAEAMNYLRGIEPEQTYSVALQTLVYCQLGAAGDLPRIRRNVQWLIASQIKPGGRAGQEIGAWSYNRRGGTGDPSNAQFALLALGAAVDRGIEVDPKTFQVALEYWTERQRTNGGWSYRGPQPSGSMTCAGVASIIIAKGRLGTAASLTNNDNITCCGNTNQEDDPIEKGLSWLARNFTVQSNPGGDTSAYLYYLYALERVGRLSGRRFIGDHDWYREGAERIVKAQDVFAGYWPETSPLEPINVATSFALLFLSKGKRQIVSARLQHTQDDSDVSWRKHPDGLRQLVRRVEQNWGRDLTWQTIDVKTASLSDLLQTPVLTISDDQPLRFGDEAVNLLRQYVDQGGTILFEADAGDGCGPDTAMTRSVQDLCAQLVPDAKLEKLPPDHPVWFAERKVDPKVIGNDYWVYGVQACCRTSIFYSPRSLMCRWELADLVFRRRKISPAARAKIEAGLGIGENIIAYATGRELKDKLESSFVIDANEIPAAKRGVTLMATLALDAGGQDARRSLANAASLVASRVPVRIAAADQPIGFDEDELADVAYLWIHGRTEFEFTVPQRKALRSFIDNGGVIISSAICGSDAFTQSFKRELGKILPSANWKPLTAEDSLVRVPGGFDLSGVTIRTPSARGDSVSKRSGIPIIDTATSDGVTCVYFSPLDISCALESPNSIQCPGYSTSDAAKIVANVILHALQQ